MNRLHACRVAVVIALLATSGGVARAQRRADPTGDKYALIVGVREYDPNELRTLSYSEPDAVELAQVLRNAGYSRVVLMTQGEGASRSRALPIAKNIRAELKGLLEDRDPGDSVLVAMIGHGVQFLGAPISYFCPMDAKLADKRTLVSIEEVYKDLEGSGAGVKVLLVDACRNDPQSDNSRSRSMVRLESVTRPQLRMPPGGVAALFSCSPGEKAYEDAGIGHGIFTHFMIRGLKGEADLDGDGSVELEELARFTKKRVPDFVKDTYGPEVRQMPVLRGEIRGLPVLVKLDRARVAAVPTPRPAVTPAPERSGQEGGARMNKDVEAGPEPTDPRLAYMRNAAIRQKALPGSQPGKTRKSLTNTLGMTLNLIPAGEFLMGSPDSDKTANPVEKPQHRVKISRPFYLGVHEVTQGQYKQISGENPSGFTGSDDLPVDKASWNEAIAFCNALSAKERLTSFYGISPSKVGGPRVTISGGSGYRLPTEAEWERACRAGGTTRFSFGDDEEAVDDHGWSGENSGNKTHPVGQKLANGYGVHDMHGNVWEWCWDRSNGYRSAAQDDPTGPDTGEDARMLRGGCWMNPRINLKTANRLAYAPGTQFPHFGFRVARSAP